MGFDGLPCSASCRNEMRCVVETARKTRPGSVPFINRQATSTLSTPNYLFRFRRNRSAPIRIPQMLPGEVTRRDEWPIRASERAAACVLAHALGVTVGLVGVIRNLVEVNGASAVDSASWDAVAHSVGRCTLRSSRPGLNPVRVERYNFLSRFQGKPLEADMAFFCRCGADMRTAEPSQHLAHRRVLTVS